MELHNRRYSRVSVDEYLIVQTGNTCNRRGTSQNENKCKMENFLIHAGEPYVKHKQVNTGTFRLLQQRRKPKKSSLEPANIHTASRVQHYQKLSPSPAYSAFVRYQAICLKSTWSNKVINLFKKSVISSNSWAL